MRAGAALALLALAACGAAQKTPELTDEVRGYGEGLRWQRHADAASRVPLRERLDFVAEREELEDDLRIDDWEVDRIEWTRPAERAVVTVRWTWHLDSRGVVHRTVSEQRWELHGKAWLMIDERRRRGEPMPGLAEPSKEAAPDADAAAGAESEPPAADPASAAGSAPAPSAPGG